MVDAKCLRDFKKWLGKLTAEKFTEAFSTYKYKNAKDTAGDKRMD